MKKALMFATLSIALAYPNAFAKSELEILRSRCSDQEKKINHLEGENSRLKGSKPQKRATIAKARPVSAAPSRNRVQASSTGHYTVVAGDSLEKIARKLGTSPRKLGALNGLKPYTIIHPGLKIKTSERDSNLAQTTAPSRKQVASRTKSKQTEKLANVSPKRKNREVTAPAKPAKREAEVLTADTGENTASGFHSTQMIAAANVPNPQEKAVSANSSASAPPSLPEQSVAPAPQSEVNAAAANEPAAPKAETKIRAITIDGEMTYGEFATKHGTDAERLNALNGLDLTTATVLAKGSELYVPAQP